MNDIPAIGSLWRHHNGNEYTVVMITNLKSERLDEYPITVVYVGGNGNIWSRPLHRWHSSMTLVTE
jgi:hypothetical protein